MVDQYGTGLGEKLRKLRQDRGWSLPQAAARSNGRFKPAAIRTYEAATRTVNVNTLADLADLYDVPIQDLLPDQHPAAEPSHGIVVDLERLEELRESADLDYLDRFVAGIQRRRHDYNGRVLSLRGADVDLLASVYDLTVDALIERLGGMGLLAERV